MIKPVTGRPFKPGQSGNPGGRPLGLASLVRDMCDDGRELVEFYYKIFKGRKKGFQSPKHRLEAAKWLTERGFGKEPFIVEPEPESIGVDSPEIEAMFDEIEHLIRTGVIDNTKSRPLPNNDSKSPDSEKPISLVDPAE